MKVLRHEEFKEGRYLVLFNRLYSYRAIVLLKAISLFFEIWLYFCSNHRQQFNQVVMHRAMDLIRVVGVRQ